MRLLASNCREGASHEEGVTVLSTMDSEERDHELVVTTMDSEERDQELVVTTMDSEERSRAG